MSTFAVKIVALDDVRQHPNADRLEISTVGGWNCVVQKGRYKAGDACIYFPLDSVLPPEVEGKIFPPDSKVKLKNSRVRTIKLRGAVSQGLVVDPELFGMSAMKVGMDITAALGITKFEPPEESLPNMMKTGSATRNQTNPNFRKYTDIENYKYYNKLFEEGEQVYVSEKIHGTSARYGYFPTECNTLWKRLLRIFGLLPKYEFCLGSRNVQLQGRLRYKGFYDNNLYGKIAKQLNLKNVLKEGEALYGEIVGDGVQKGYTYGFGPGQHGFLAYDVMVDGAWLNYAEFCAWCDGHSIPRVPSIYVGAFSYEKMNELRQGDSVLCPSQKVREGVVIKPLKEELTYAGRKVLKFISDDYLLKDQSDYH